MGNPDRVFDLYYFPGLKVVYLDGYGTFGERLDAIFKYRNKTSDIDAYRDEIIGAIYKHCNPQELVLGTKAY